MASCSPAPGERGRAGHQGEGSAGRGGLGAGRSGPTSRKLRVVTSGPGIDGPLGPSCSAIWMIWARCSACRSEAWRICERQLKPSVISSGCLEARRIVEPAFWSRHASLRFLDHVSRQRALPLPTIAPPTPRRCLARSPWRNTGVVRRQRRRALGPQPDRQLGAWRATPWSPRRSCTPRERSDGSDREP